MVHPSFHWAQGCPRSHGSVGHRDCNGVPFFLPNSFLLLVSCSRFLSPRIRAWRLYPLSGAPFHHHYCQLEDQSDSGAPPPPRKKSERSATFINFWRVFNADAPSSRCSAAFSNVLLSSAFTDAAVRRNL